MPRPPYPDGEYPDDPNWCADMDAYLNYNPEQEEFWSEFFFFGVITGFFDWLFGGK